MCLDKTSLEWLINILVVGLFVETSYKAKKGDS